MKFSYCVIFGLSARLASYTWLLTCYYIDWFLFHFISSFSGKAFNATTSEDTISASLFWFSPPLIIYYIHVILGHDRIIKMATPFAFWLIISLFLGISLSFISFFIFSAGIFWFQIGFRIALIFLIFIYHKYFSFYHGDNIISNSFPSIKGVYVTYQSFIGYGQFLCCTSTILIIDISLAYNGFLFISLQLIYFC